MNQINETHRSKLSNYVLHETVLFAFIGLFDLISTIYLIASHRAIEANPMLAAVLTAYGVVGFAVFKAIMIGGPLAGAEFARRWRPRFVQLALRAGIAAYLAIYVVGSMQFNLISNLR